MVEQLHHKSDLRGGPVDVVLPDVPPGAGAFALRALHRLQLRRWLVVLSLAVIWLYVAAYNLPLLPAIGGSVVMIGGAAFLRRESIFRQTSIPRHASDRECAAVVIDAMLEGLPAPVMLLDMEGKVLRFNGQAKDLFKMLRAEHHLSAFFRDPGVLECVAKAGASRLPRQTVRYDARVPIERHMEVTIAWIGPAHGRVTSGTAAILLYMDDLTELEALNAMRSDFVSNASHELRTPLASVLGFIETLQGPARDDAVARERFLAIMARQAQRMARLIDDLLSLSRIEMHMHLRPLNRVDLNEVMQHVVVTLEPVAEKSEIALHFTAVPGDATVLGDRDQLVQVFSNLAENAIKYGRSGGNVWLAIEPRGDGRKFAVSVHDDGRGIEEKHLPRLTERFYRADGEKSGTGLGLAIVKHTIVRHRGELTITSEAGKGSVFTVVLERAA